MTTRSISGSPKKSLQTLGYDNRLREGWLNPEGVSAAELKRRTLTNLYNQRPTWLDNIHARLDAAVADAYGWPADLANGEILERLLALNLERAGEEG